MTLELIARLVLHGQRSVADRQYQEAIEIIFGLYDMLPKRFKPVIPMPPARQNLIGRRRYHEGFVSWYNQAFGILEGVFEELLKDKKEEVTTQKEN